MGTLSMLLLQRLSKRFDRRALGAGFAAALSLFTLLPADASAAAKKPAEEKKQGVLQMKAPEDVKVDKAGPSKVRAPTSEDDVARDAAADAKRDEEVTQLLQIIPNIPDEAPQKADLIFQLAELYWEKSRYVALTESKEYDDTYAKWLGEVDKKGQKAAGPEPRMVTTRSDDQRKKSLQQYQALLKLFPNYPRKDEVLFVVSYNLYESGQKAEALANYNTLIKQYPQSKFVPDAYVQMGEHYFAGNDLTRARAAYEKATQYKQPKIYAFALYKLAWCDYNAQEYQASIDKFKEVVTYAEQQAAVGGQRDRVQLKGEALKDVVLAYAQIDAIDSAVSYLKEKGGPKSLDYINKLAATYFETGKYDQAIRVYKLLESENPNHLRAPAWQQKILLAYDKLNKRDRVVAEMKVLVDRFGPKSEWAKANADQKGALQEATELAESAMRELVQDYHQEAIRTKSVATYKLARDIYRQYLDTFPDNESAYSLRFYYAEILYALEDWEAAANAYTEVIELNPKGDYAPRASYNTILALEKQVAISKGTAKKSELSDATRIDEKKAKGQVEQKRTIRDEKITKDTVEEPIPALEQRLIAACEKYLNVAPGSKDEIVIRYKAAFVYYDHRHYVEAAKRFGDIILRWPNDVWSQKAAELSMNILEVKEQWQPLSELAQKFRADKSIAPPGSEFSKKLARIAEGARFKYVMDIYENKKDYPLAAAEFKAFVETYPKSENAHIALNNGIIIAEKANQLDLVISSAEQLLRDYPKSELSILKPARRSLAAAYERAARYPEAVAAYLAYADIWPQDEKSADMVFNAALWKEGLGDDAAAVQLWQRYLKAYPGRPDAAKIAFNIGLILTRQKDWKKVADFWYAYQRDYAKSAAPGQLLLARYNEGIAMREVKPDDKNLPLVMTEVTRRFAQLPETEKLPPVVDAAAHARFLLLEGAFNDFQAIHFNYTRQQDLVFVLKVKSSRMTKLHDAYTDLIKFGSPLYSEAALCRLGEAYGNYNKKLLEAPMPKGLTPDQEDLYRSTLENQALPLEDKAVEAFEKAISTASKTGVYSDWTLRAQEQLKSFKPDAYGEVHKLAPMGAEPLSAVQPDGVSVKSEATPSSGAEPTKAVGSAGGAP